MVGEFGEALVMDWGIAKNVAQAGAAESADEAVALGEADTLVAPGDGDATAHGTVMGTPAYMSPEQARGDIEALDQRTDVYALGAVLYFLISGHPPHDGRRAQEVIAKAIDEAPPALTAIDHPRPRPLVAICSKAMTKRAAERYATVRQLADDVGAFLDGRPVSAYRDDIIDVVERFVSRNRGLLALLSAYLVVRVLLALM